MIGESVSHYRVLSRLGAGGMGVVYLAEDVLLGRKVALKFLNPALAGSVGTRERFIREARAVSTLNHPNICTVHEVGEHDGLPFMAMELLEGEVLATSIGNHPLPLERLLDLAIQIADALEAAHAAGVVHRDIKPANIYVTSHDRIKVLDFGIAKLITGATDAAGMGETVASEPELTDRGIPIGTVSYMSPEQARGLPVDARSDLFSLGIVLYQMATGALPFPGATWPVISEGILRNPPTVPAAGNPSFPPALLQIAEKALEKDPELRYQSATELRADLKRLKRGTDSASLGAHPPWHGPTRAPTTTARWVLAAVAAGTLIGAAVFGWVRQGASAPIDSVAVLPFVNEGGGEHSDYVSDGLPGELINSLAQLRTIRVVPRTLAARYQGADIDLRQVAKDLQVRAVVTGRVRQRGDIITVHAELIDTQDVSQLWGEQYARPIADLLAVQTEISKAIVAGLRAELSGAEASRLDRAPTASSAAYELYLRGRYVLKQRSDEDTSRAIAFFEQAIVADPQYALAHSGLADAHLLSFNLPPSVTMPRSQVAAQRAVELDDSLAEAHTTLGLIAHSHDFNWPQAGRHFERAIELNPSYATAHHWFGLYLAHAGQMSRAIDEIQRALALDPMASGIAADAAQLLLFSRRYAEALPAFREVLQLNPAYTRGRRFLGMTYSLMGHHDEAIAELSSARKASASQDAMLIAALGYAYAMAGRPADARRVIDDLAVLRRTQYVSASHTGTVLVGLGEREHALEWFEQALQDRSLWSAWLDLDPRYDSLRDEPRFRGLLRQLGLPK